MSYERPIDDPEVRRQHDRDLRGNLLACFIAPVFLGAWTFGMSAIGLVVDVACGVRAPARVVAVDRSGGTVSVSSSDSRIPHSMVFRVDDTDAYGVEDHVGVVLTGEQHEPAMLDREPMLPVFLHVALDVGKVVVGIMLLGVAGVMGFASRRRRALHRPWRRTQAVLFDDRERCFAYLAEVDGGSYWRLADVEADLPNASARDVDVAGFSRYLVVRFSGTTKLATARRRRARPKWGDLR